MKLADGSGPYDANRSTSFLYVLRRECSMLCALRILSVIAIAVALLGCVASDADEAKALRDVSIPSSMEPVLRPGDRVQVTVFGEDKITGAYEVDSAGLIALPLTGSVKAEGASARELEAAVALRLRQTYIRNPRVTVNIASLRPFYILGEVEKPGEYSFKTGLNLWRAIAIAGGQTYRASSSSVFIQHAGEAKMTEYDTSNDVAVRPGDLIRVPERWF